MKEPATNESEKIDPLTRIQEEIKEVQRREQEYLRQLTTSGTTTLSHEFELNISNNKIDNNESNQLIQSNEHNFESDLITINSEIPNTSEMEKTTPNVAMVTSLVVHEDNASSLASSVNSKESLDEHHSDDSGISASSSPINNSEAGVIEAHIDTLKASGVKEHRYIGPNCYNMTPEPPQQKLLVHTVATPQLNATRARQFAFSPAHKGVMQRFIASRGKLQLNNNNTPSNQIILNSKTAAALINPNPMTHSTPPNTPVTPSLNPALISDFLVKDPASIIIPTVTLAPSVIERDADGRPIRPGYVPVELKIQRELKDIKTRESELKKIRKIRQSNPDLLDSIDNENLDSDDDDDSEVEHCYGPGQLRTAKSISELCDATHSNISISPRATPSPEFHNRMGMSRTGGMRPAMSLAQLCDLDPEEAPSSHRLIAQWESLIQQNA